MWDDEKVREIVNNTDVDSDVCKDLTKSEIIQARELVWYKLFKLLNYNVSMNMFKGSVLRWKSIKCYLTTIRGIYNGKITEFYNGTSKYSPKCIKYIEGLMASGEEPYPVPEEKRNCSRVSIQTLLNSDLITPNDVRFIYSNVSPKHNLPDTSLQGTRNSNGIHVTNPITERMSTPSLVLLDALVGVNKIKNTPNSIDLTSMYKAFCDKFKLSL